MSENEEQLEAVTIATASSAPEAAQDELVREFQVRKRCFAKWVSDGRLSMTDALDRLNRLGVAIKLVRMAESAARQVTSSGDKAKLAL